MYQISNLIYKLRKVAKAVDPRDVLVKLVATRPELHAKLSDATFLGSGTYGVAFLVDGKAYKVTQDRVDAKASAKMMKAGAENVAQIYEVFKIKGTDLYAIVQELLFPLKGTERYVVDHYAGDFVDGRITVAEIRFRLLDRHMRIYDRDLRRLLSDVKNGVEELRSHGIQWEDYHSDNIMKDKNGAYKIVDLGVETGKGINLRLKSAERDVRAREGLL